MRVLVGTSGYNYPEWKGAFYPTDLPATRMLAYYAERFSTVEINATFYRVQTPKTLASWAAATPPHFTFALKAPKRITHDARLKDVDEPVRYFCDVARTLGAKLGPVLFQLAPSFKKDLGRLGDLLVMLPAALRCAFEFRHDSWLADDVYELLRSRNAALCIADTGNGTTPLVATADFGYFRLRDEGYSEEDLNRWSQTVRRLGGTWRDAFVYFKHEESGTGPALGQRLQELLAGPHAGSS
ncbi:MAG: DUF72 domain-containing protein [Candidatus Rokubacteria bacterium]|nr:DUF72 domain-containing protein [Candidatus Rokubacteria bacterium]